MSFSRLFFIVVTLMFCAASSQAQQNDLLLIFDASGSMWGQVEGENKIVIARRVLGNLAIQLSDDANVGLIAYGHRREADCADIETLVPIGPLDRTALTGAVNTINPKGKTPITDSIRQAVAAAKARDKATTIVLLSDGIETCNADPCAAVREAKLAGGNFLLHVIGFDLSAENVAPLECAAQAGGGLYFDAKNAADLTAALDQAVAAPEVLGDASLSVQAIQNGQLTDVGLTVKDAAGKGIAVGRTYTSPATNPRILPVPAGVYSVTAVAVGLRGNATQTLTDVEIKSGETVERIFDFSSGEVAVGVTRNGALSDATVNVFAAGTRTGIAGGRTYTSASSNPRVFEITPGLYDIEVASVEIASKATSMHRYENVVIKPQERVDLSQEFPSGIAKIGAVVGSELVDAVVNLQAEGEARPSIGARTYTSANSNPREFILTPGRYKATIAPLRVEGSPKREIEIEVRAGETVEQVIDFGR